MSDIWKPCNPVLCTLAAALSSDGKTAIVGGDGDNDGVGAAWVFVNGPTPPANPAITGIVNDASFTAGGPISTGSWVAIFGTGLAPAGDSRKWNEATEIVNGRLPVSLDGTSVMVNGKPAAVEYIQPSQVNIQPPDDTALGPVQVIVNTAAGASNSFMVSYATFAPGLFPASAPYIVAQHADNSYVTTAAPAKPGEVIILWGTGFGPANPAVPAGQVFSRQSAREYRDSHDWRTARGRGFRGSCRGRTGPDQRTRSVQYRQWRRRRSGQRRRRIDADHREHDPDPQLSGSFRATAIPRYPMR